MPGSWLARAILVVAISVTGCGEQDEATGDPTGGNGSGEPGIPAPAFVEPATNMLEVQVDRTGPISMTVEEIYDNNTTLLVDDTAVGTARINRPDLTLNDHELVFELAGGLTPGLLHLQLMTRNGDDQLRSTPVELSIVPRETIVPIAGELASEPVANGDFIAHAGTSGKNCALLVRDDSGSVPVAHVLFGWDPADAFVFPLPDFESTAHSEAIGVAASVVQAPSEEQPLILQVAWATGSAPDTLVGRRLTGPPEPSLGPQATLLSQELFANPSQWFAIGRTLLVGPSLVAEVYAPVDIESPHPGDHRLITRSWNAASKTLGPVRHYYNKPLEDFDQLAPALDLVGLTGGVIEAVSFRRGGTSPALLLTDEDRWQLEVANSATDVGLRGEVWMTTARSSLWSWQTWGVSTTGDAAVVLQRTLPETPLQHITVPRGDDGLPASVEPSGEPALIMVAGIPRLLIPYGTETAVHAVASNGTEALVQPLDGIACDALAVQQTLAANTEDGTVPFACLAANNVHLGSFKIAE